MFDPLLAKGLIVTLHAFAAMAAIILGAVQLLAAKGTRQHQLLGKLWVALILGVAISSFWIHDARMFGPWSIIHLLSIFTIYAVITAVRYARRGEIDSHRRSMQKIYGLALILTGGFTLWPGRAMHSVLFGG